MLDLLGRLGDVGGYSGGGTAGLAIALLVILLSIWSLQKPAANMPPGPLGYPFIGNLFDLSEKPWLDYIRISKKYGPIFSHKLVTLQTVVVNSLELTHEALLKKQADFAGRPHFYATDLLTDGGKSISLGDFGPVWKVQKKIGHSAIRTYAMGERLEALNHQVYPLIEDLFGKKTGPFDPKDSLYLVVYNIISTMVFGCKYSMEDEEFQQIMGTSRDLIETFGNGFAADIIPGAQYIPTPGLRKAKKLIKRLKNILYRKLKEHQENFDPDHLKDLVDYFLNAQKEAVTGGEDEAANRLTDSHIVQMFGDVFFAGTDTSIYTSMYWAIAFMARHPPVRVKVHREICDLMGEDRSPGWPTRSPCPTPPPP